MKKVLFTMMKSLAIFLTLQAQSAEWAIKTVVLGESKVRISYSKEYLPPTYGAQGGMAINDLYIDIEGDGPISAESVKIRNKDETNDFGQLYFQQVDTRHAYTHRHKGGKPSASYADFLWIGRTYQLEITVNGQVVETSLVP